MTLLQHTATTIDPYIRDCTVYSQPGVGTIVKYPKKQTRGLETLRDERSVDRRLRPPQVLDALTGRELARTEAGFNTPLVRKDSDGYSTDYNGKLWYWHGYAQLVGNGISGWMGYADPPLPAWQNKIRDKFAKQIFSLAADTPQWRQSYSFWKGTAGKALDAWRDMRAMRFGKYMSPKAWGSAHLQFTYAIKPDIETLIEAVERTNAHFGFPPRGVVRAEVTEYGGRGTRREFFGGQTHEAVVRTVRATVFYRNAPFRMFLNPGSPLEWAWELLPYSYVLDWLVGVGKWLSQADALKGVYDVHGYYTDRIWRECGTTDSTFAGYTCTKPGWFKGRSHSRSTFTTVPLPALQFKDPLKLSPGHQVERTRVIVDLLGNALTQAPKRWGAPDRWKTTSKGAWPKDAPTI